MKVTKRDITVPVKTEYEYEITLSAKEARFLHKILGAMSTSDYKEFSQEAYYEEKNGTMFWGSPGYWLFYKLDDEIRKSEAN